MPSLDLKPKAEKFIKSLPPKHKKEVKQHILGLRENPFPQDSKKLTGYKKYNRTDVGEYRVIYRHDKKNDVITVVLVGKRNDDEIYRIARRNLK